MSHFYDRNGRPLDLLEWAGLFEDKGYRILRHTHLPSGVMVSTVWLGIDHSFLSGERPVIFETMVFPDPRKRHDSDDLACWRYTTEANARAGHERMMRNWRFKRWRHRA